MLETLKEKWNEILKYLKEEYDISDVSFDTWLLPLEVYALEQPGNIVKIIVPDANFLGYIKKKYSTMLMVSIAEVTGIKCDSVQFLVEEDIVPEPAASNQLIQNNTNTVSPATLQNANLNPKYTFDTFVVGANNNLAHAASLAVAESPGEIYNPLFIYGGVGLGKTHLMHSIANFILKNNPKAKILYVTSEKFTNELIDAIRNKNNISTTEFREKYRNKKQIIISSDKPPKEIETLEERLRSRFEWGLTVDIQSPDYETRMAILRKKEEMEGYNIDNEVIKYIATNIKSNIRELEGALTKIVALSKLEKNREIDIELAEKALKDIIAPGDKQEVTPEFIIQIVADHFNLTPLDIMSAKRSKEIVYPRQIVMYLCRTMTETGLQNIGKALGGRDHTTILHGIKTISADLEKNPSLQNTIDILKKKISPQ